MHWGEGALETAAESVVATTSTNDDPGSEALPLSRLLSWRPLVYLGLISYALYLWHLPVYKLLYRQLDGWPWGLVAAIAVTLSLALASLSYRFVERPFLGHRRAAAPNPSAVPSGEARTVAS